MKTRFWLFFFVSLSTVSIFSVFCQADTIVLSIVGNNHTIPSGNYDKVYGNSASNQITLESGASGNLFNFPGQNSIQFQSSSDLFTVFRYGSFVTLSGSDGTRLTIPATTDPQTIAFAAEANRVLQIINGRVMLDDQEITSTPAGIDDNQNAPVTCGAYLAPKVWKEFDCYNLAAIGKTTNDDPFTPSWRLIGGYWQWGRKGPDESQWYDTNTEHFAHGPTGPNSEDANSEEISDWEEDNAPEVGWSDSSKTDNDPCPSGFKIPTIAQWQGVLDNNTQRAVGTWSKSETNYSSALFLGNDLMLPAGGWRTYGHGGALDARGNAGFYWSSSPYDSVNASDLFFGIGNAGTYEDRYFSALTVRCSSF